MNFMAISLKLICLFYDYPYFICIMVILGLYLKIRVNFSFLSNWFLNSHIVLIKNPTKLTSLTPSWKVNNINCVMVLYYLSRKSSEISFHFISSFPLIFSLQHLQESEFAFFNGSSFLKVIWFNLLKYSSASL